MTKRRVTPRELKRLKEMGTKALAKYKRDHPESQALHPMKHGAKSIYIRTRYSDKRRRGGRQLAAIMNSLICDLRGNDEVFAGQRLILDNIKSKLIVILQIGKYVDKQLSIVNAAGEVLPCLDTTYRQYADSLRKDIEALYAIHKKPGKAPSLEDYLKNRYAK